MEELGVSGLRDLFSEFSDKPLGTASLAQVHKARLKEDGSVVAVKIQHPNVRDLADKDMNMMDVAVKLVSYFARSNPVVLNVLFRSPFSLHKKNLSE